MKRELLLASINATFPLNTSFQTKLEPTSRDSVIMPGRGSKYLHKMIPLDRETVTIPGRGLTSLRKMISAWVKKLQISMDGSTGSTAALPSNFRSSLKAMWDKVNLESVENNFTETEATDETSSMNSVTSTTFHPDSFSSVPGGNYSSTKRVITPSAHGLLIRTLKPYYDSNSESFTEKGQREIRSRLALLNEVFPGTKISRNQFLGPKCLSPTTKLNFVKHFLQEYREEAIEHLCTQLRRVEEVDYAKLTLGLNPEHSQYEEYRNFINRTVLNPEIRPIEKADMITKFFASLRIHVGNLITLEEHIGRLVAHAKMRYIARALLPGDPNIPLDPLTVSLIGLGKVSGKWWLNQITVQGYQDILEGTNESNPHKFQPGNFLNKHRLSIRGNNAYSKVVHQQNYLMKNIPSKNVYGTESEFFDYDSPKALEAK